MGISSKSFVIATSKFQSTLVDVYANNKPFNLDVFFEDYLNKKVLLVTTSELYELHAEKVVNFFNSRGISMHVFFIPSGEKSKSMETAVAIIDEALSIPLERKDALLAFGGGVVCDVVAFACSIYMRGISLIFFPTTLLAQVDAAVGGKTAINHPRGKNLIGSFYHPDYIFMNISNLKTLNQREVRSGLSEVIKYGIIYDSQFFSYLEEYSNIFSGLKVDDASMDYWYEVVAKSVDIKRAVVEEDTEEGGLRAILNFGHTVGHALERYYGYEDILVHGEAVAIGMIFAAHLSMQKGYIDQKDYDRIFYVLNAVGFTLKLSELVSDISELPSLDDLFVYMYKDKKVDQGILRFVLIDSIGHAFVSKEISQIELKNAMEAIL